MRGQTRQAWVGLLRRVREQQVATIPYEATPFDCVARAAGWPPETTGFGCLLQYQYLPDDDPLDEVVNRQDGGTGEEESWKP